MKRIFKRIVSLLMIVAFTSGSLFFDASAIANAADEGITYYYFNGHTYALFDEGMSWHDSKTYCEDLGGHLATITTEAEHTFLIGVMEETSLPVLFYFLGGSRSSSSDSWQWITDESFVFSHWGINQSDKGYISIANFDTEDVATDAMIKKLLEEEIFFKMNQFYWYAIDSTQTVQQSMLIDVIGGFICEWDYIIGDCYEIAGRYFYENLDYYTEYCDSSTYNVGLANMTAALSEAVYSENDIDNAYNSLGFSSCYVYDYDGSFNPATCGYAMDFKKSDYSDDTICLVTVRGSSNTSDWIGNIALATLDSEKHIGFSYPANRIYNTIQSQIESQNITGNIKYVITGHSRGAAVANLLSVKLMENSVSSSDVYNYNFACPDVACKSSFPSYNNIFNLCNREDIVPFVPGPLISSYTTPGTAWGKFGETYWFTKDAPDTINPFSDHKMSLYLEFFDEQKNPSEWSSSFKDKVDDITYKITGFITKVFCPVDVTVTDKHGNEMASVINGEVNYYNNSCGDVIIFVNGDKKIIYIDEDVNFNVNLVGTDSGEMTYAVEELNLLTDEIIEAKTFTDVKLEAGKTMYSPVSNAETTEDVELLLVNNDDKKTITHTIDVDGTENKLFLSIAAPETRTVYLGESVKLSTNTNLPDEYRIKWVVEGEGVSIKASSSGETCKVTSKSTGKVVIKAYVVDSWGNIITDENGKQICDSEYLYSESNLWLIIVNFFKKLFKIGSTAIQVFNYII